MRCFTNEKSSYKLEQVTNANGLEVGPVCISDPRRVCNEAVWEPRFSILRLVLLTRLWLCLVLYYNVTLSF